MAEYVIKPKIEFKVTDQDIDDIMATALDCGISYWCREAEVVGGEYRGEWASDEISRGGILRLNDAESDDKWLLTKNKFLKGIKLWAESGWCRESNIDQCFFEGKLDTGNIDAIEADVIVQLALFGEVVFG